MSQARLWVWIAASLIALANPALAQLRSDPEARSRRAKTPKKLPLFKPYAGSFAYWTHCFSFVSLGEHGEFTSDPAYTMALGLDPQWEMVKNLTWAMHVGWETQLAGSGQFQSRAEAFFEDIPLKVRYRRKIRLNAQVELNTGLDLNGLVPSSSLSRYLTLQTALGFGALGLFYFPEVLRGFTLGLAPNIAKYVYESKTPGSVGGGLRLSRVEQLTSPRYQTLRFGQGENADFSLETTLHFGLALSAEALFLFAYTNTYIQTYGGQHLYAHTFAYDLRYRLPGSLRMISLSLSALTGSGELGPGAEYRKPFFNQTTLFTLGLIVNIDGVVSSALGQRYRYNQAVELQRAQERWPQNFR